MLPVRGHKRLGLRVERARLLGGSVRERFQKRPHIRAKGPQGSHILRSCALQQQDRPQAPASTAPVTE